MKKKVFKIKSDCIFICQFALDDFKTKYAGSVLGFVWAFIQPVITVVIYWFIFQLGFKNGDVNGFPFILWLISGLLPWFFVSDAIINASSSLMEYSYLVKKVVFNIDILPLARVVSVLFVQIFLLTFTGILYVAYACFPQLGWIQLFYYAFYMFVCCVGIAYFTSALYAFFRDTIQIVSIILQIVFWLTPIVWQENIFDEKVINILKFNPLYYIARGYRDALMKGNFFWEYEISQTIYYWIVALLLFGIGIFVFHKLKPHFADVL